MKHVPLATLSRTAGSHPLGKLVDLPNVRIAEPTLAGLRRLAAEAGVPFSEFVRVYLETRVHGTEHVAIVAGDRVRRIAGIGPTTGLTGLNRH